MQYYRCKCGKREYFDGGMSPRACQGCNECGTTLEQSPERHKTPEPHEWVPQYNESTGKRESDRCKNCYEKRINVEGINYDRESSLE